MDPVYAAFINIVAFNTERLTILAICLTANISVNLVVFVSQANSTSSNATLVLHMPARATPTSLPDADQGLMAPASGYSAVHILWIGDMYADGSCVRGVY